MYHQTHHPSGRHRHNAVFDWRLLRPGDGDRTRTEADRPPVLHTRQLDYLYSQLEDLKTNMREKQSSLATIIDVQKKKIEKQGSIILDLDQKLKFNQQKSSTETNNFVFRDFVKHEELSPVSHVKYTEDNKAAPLKPIGKNFRELYQKAKENTRIENQPKSEACEDSDVYDDDDDDNDSFITIDEDYEDLEDDSGGSDSTLENSHSSDSGYTDSNGSSYGVNPMFSLQPNDGTEACQDDFLFFNQKKDGSQKRNVSEADTISIEQKSSSSKLFGSLKKSHRIVIINKETALVCNESCLI